MGLKDFSPLDLAQLKNIDIHLVKDVLQKRPDILINIILISVTIGAIVFIYDNQQKEIKSLKKKTAEYQEKLKAIKEDEGLKEKLNAFLESFPEQIQTDKLTSKISQMAVAHNIQIGRFSPAQEKETDYITVATLSFNISTEDYKNLTLFIQNIEQSPYSIRIKKWSTSVSAAQDTRRQSRYQPSQQEEAMQKRAVINSELEIESIILKND